MAAAQRARPGRRGGLPCCSCCCPTPRDQLRSRRPAELRPPAERQAAGRLCAARRKIPDPDRGLRTEQRAGGLLHRRGGLHGGSHAEVQAMLSAETDGNYRRRPHARLGAGAGGPAPAGSGRGAGPAVRVGQVRKPQALDGRRRHRLPGGGQGGVAADHAQVRRAGGSTRASPDAESLAQAYDRFSRLPGFEGVVVAEMLSGRELIVGAKIDFQFGPVILLGIGGTAVEIYKDTATRMAPLKPSRRCSRCSPACAAAGCSPAIAASPPSTSPKLTEMMLALLGSGHGARRPDRLHRPEPRVLLAGALHGRRRAHRAGAADG
ncbi:MAG: acetate--CoA ligase family protein [Desulfobacterales bacterium]|nr:acetate--CoA ligase family protein [Desulfobacterales bacterium]